MDDEHFALLSDPEADQSTQTADPIFPARLRRAVADLILATTAESIWLIDSQARTTFVNRRMADLLGYTEAEMIGRPIFDFLDPSDWPTAADNLKKRESGLEDRREIRLTREDGTRVWILGSANPVFDQNGCYAGALALLNDLSEQKEVSAARTPRSGAWTLRARCAGNG